MLSRWVCAFMILKCYASTKVYQSWSNSMGVIKWTGKAFNLAGKILTAEGVEQWLENEGKKLLEERVSDISKKWFFGKSRAKKIIKNEALEVTNSSQAFKASLNQVLNDLPIRELFIITFLIFFLVCYKLTLLVF